MAELNTGYKAYTGLMKVVNGGPHNGEALDGNNHLCSVSGLPQSKKPNNAGDPDYVSPIYDPTSCPLPTINIINNSQVILGVTTSGGLHYSSSIHTNLVFPLPIGESYILYNQINSIDPLYVNAKVVDAIPSPQNIYGLTPTEFAAIQGMNKADGLAYANGLSKHIADISNRADITVTVPDTYFINSLVSSQTTMTLVLAAKDGTSLPVYSFTPLNLNAGDTGIVKVFSIYMNLAKFGWAVTRGSTLVNVEFKGVVYNIASQISLGNFTTGTKSINGVSMDWYQTNIDYGTTTPYTIKFTN